MLNKDSPLAKQFVAQPCFSQHESAIRTLLLDIREKKTGGIAQLRQLAVVVFVGSEEKLML